MIQQVVFIFFIFSNVVSSDLKKMREHFALMSKNEDSVKTIKEIAITSNEVSVNLKKAYYAAAEMSSAQYKINPASKLKAFSSGKNFLEATVLADTSNIEVRYIRYTIQENAPAFLGYNKSISRDKAFLINHLNQIKKEDPDLYSKIYSYLLLNSKLTKAEKTLINE